MSITESNKRQEELVSEATDELDKLQEDNERLSSEIEEFRGLLQK